MPDTQPITNSFPWFAVRYKPVFNNLNIGGSGTTSPVFIVSESGKFIVSETGPFLVTGVTTTVGSFGDLYRYV